MAVQLFKLVIDAATTTTTAINPDVQRYFYAFDPDDVEDTTLVIPATDMIDDEGNQLAGNLPVIEPENGYYQLFVNGVLQQTDLYSISPDGSEIAVENINTDTIPEGAPIILVAASFAPTSDSSTTVIT